MDLVGNRTLRDLLEERVELYGDRPCLIFEDKEGRIQRYTYREMNGWVDRAAEAFDRLGIKKGDKVTVHLPNCSEFLFAWFGLAKIGAVMVPSNTANMASEMLHVINYSDSVALLTEPAYMPLFREVLPKCPNVQSVILARADNASDGALLFSSLLAESTGRPPRPSLHSEEEQEIIFTSGTTSLPKGVMLTHAIALHSGERMSRHLGLGPEDLVLTALPAFHCNAQSSTILAAWTAGAAAILLEVFSASKFWEQIRSHKATCTSLVPALLRTIMAQPFKSTDGDHYLRTNFYAINVTDKEKEEFEKRFKLELVNGYGLSEAMTVVTVAPRLGPKRWPSIGLPAGERAVKIVDDQGHEVPTGETGEIICQGVPGRTLMKGYYKDPEATAKTIKNGWLHTGDNGYMDEFGYVYFFDRKKDVIKRGAENVSASEVERVLQDHPDITEAAVIAVPDPIKDEAVKAYVVLQPGASVTVEQIIEYCRANLAKFKVPSFVVIRDALPKTSVGKVEKKVLRAESQ